MKSLITLPNAKPTVPFRIVLSIVTIAPLWLPLAPINTSVHAQSSDVVSNSATASPSSVNWMQLLRDNMQRWNPFETAIGINNANNLKLKWKTDLDCQSGNTVD